MQTKQKKPPVVDQLYEAYLQAGGEPGTKQAFVCGLQASMWFFDLIREQHNEDPHQAAKALMKFKADVQEGYDKLKMPEAHETQD